jgi:hypothetical protein
MAAACLPGWRLVCHARKTRRETRPSPPAAGKTLAASAPGMTALTRFCVFACSLQLLCPDKLGQPTKNHRTDRGMSRESSAEYYRVNQEMREAAMSGSGSAATQ